MRAALQSKTHSAWRATQALVFLGVLSAHVGLLLSSPLLFAPVAQPNTSSSAFVTQMIELPAPPRKPPSVSPGAPAKQRAPSPQALDSPLGETTAASPATPDDSVPGQTMEPESTPPVTLPPQVAQAVDSPPETPGVSAISGAEITAFKPPTSSRLKYNLSGFSNGFQYYARGDLRWRQDGQSYEARMEVSAFLLGSREQTSIGDLGSEGLMPRRFVDKSRNELVAHFQRDKNIISFSANTPDAALLKGAQDRLSIVFQLGALLAAEPQRFPVGTTLSFQTVSQRETEVWQFVVEKSERLDLPYAEIDTLKLNRNPRREFDQRIELWLAPSLGFLPARLRITNANGDYVDQLLRTVETPWP